MDRRAVEQLIAEHGIETVKIGTPDMDGVYRGKRVSAKQFLAGCESAGLAQCDVIFGWDIGEEPITSPGLAIGTADTGFADVLLRPDLATFRLVPWEPATAAVVCDVCDEQGDLVPQSPRTVLRRVIDRAAACRRSWRSTRARWTVAAATSTGASGGATAARSGTRHRSITSPRRWPRTCRAR